MRTLLIRPRATGDAGPPMGILQLAAALKQRDHPVMVADVPPTGALDWSEVRRFDPELVGLSLLTPQVARAGVVLQDLCRSIPGGFRTVAGGIHPTALPEETLLELELDAVVIGEGDLTLPELADVWEGGGDLAEVAGLAFRGPDGKVRFTPPRALVADLDSLPLPDREAVPFRKYLRPPGNIRGLVLRRGTPMIIGRGCPFHCTFCSSHRLFGRRVRLRSVEAVLGEIDQLVERYQIDGIWFLDDTLMERADYLARLCQGMIERPWQLRWSCQAHATRLHPELLPLMRRAGCIQIEFGVESGSRRVLRRLRKGQTPEQVLEAFLAVRRAGIRSLANFMLGSPGETPEDLEQSFRLARMIRPDHLVVTFTTPLPGSELFDQARREGWIPQDVAFGPEWTIRQTESPRGSLGMDPELVQAYRARFDNAFFWRNHAGYLRDPTFLTTLMAFLIRHPAVLGRGFHRAWRTRRLGHLVETLWEVYSQPS